MDWFRRNWPDLLIGIALVAVIAGIIATLITGGSFFPVGQGTRTSTPPAQTQSAAPSATSPSTSTTTPSSSATSSGTSTSGSAAGTSAPSGSAGTSTAPSATSSSAPASSGSSAAASGGVSVLPPNGTGTTSSSTSPATSSGSAGSGSSAATPSTPSSTTTSSAATTSTTSTTSAAAANGPGSSAPYRVSVGAFSHADYAQRQEEVFKKAGYPAFLATQGDLTIVLVGPYTSQSEAESVAAKIKSGGFGVDPVVYEFKGTQDSAPQPASAPASTSSAPASTAASTASAPAASTSTATQAGDRYLQVGAYGSSDSAKPQRDRLEQMGYRVTERTENGLVKLLIGPFGADRLQQVQAQLKTAGIDSFPR